MTRTCPACGGALTRWREVRGGEPADTRLYPLLRCASCGSAVTDSEPPPAELYETGQYGQTPPRLPGPVAWFQRVVKRQPVGFLRRTGLKRGARVLDVGAGTGKLVQLLEEGGYRGAGID